jgi:hypothetical protein
MRQRKIAELEARKQMADAKRLKKVRDREEEQARASEEQVKEREAKAAPPKVKKSSRPKQSE